VLGRADHGRATWERGRRWSRAWRRSRSKACRVVSPWRPTSTPLACSITTRESSAPWSSAASRPRSVASMALRMSRATSSVKATIASRSPSLQGWGSAANTATTPTACSL
jgi:hypothetical protein